MKNLRSVLKGLFALLAIILAVWFNGVDSLFEEQTPDSSISIAASSSQTIEESIQESETQESAETNNKQRSHARAFLFNERRGGGLHSRV